MKEVQPTYKGKHIEEMTKEELIQALKNMGSLYQQALIKLLEDKFL